MKLNYEKIVLSLSGSFFSDADLIKEYAKTIKKIKKHARLFCVVTGGGKAARDYISLAKSLGLGRKKQDEIGIALTRVNALLLGMLLGFEKIPASYKEAVKILKQNGFAICGGMVPGQSTDKVAADIASMTRAQILINLTKVEGVYDKNPKMKGAKLLKRLTYEELRKILSRERQSPGEYALFDLKAISVVKKARIPVIIASGLDPKNLLRILKGEALGTIVSRNP